MFDGELPETLPQSGAVLAVNPKAQVREIITAYADRVSNIPEDKYAEVMAKLTALEGSGQA